MKNARAEALPGFALFAAMLAGAGLPIYIHAPKFYVDQYGVSLAALGGVLFVLRLFDFVQDPVLGWLSGNIYMMRRRTLPEGGRWKKLLLLAYLLGPPGMVYLIRALASPSLQQAAPFVPIYSFGVYVIFFLVPVTLRASAPPRHRP